MFEGEYGLGILGIGLVTEGKESVFVGSRAREWVSGPELYTSEGDASSRSEDKFNVVGKHRYVRLIGSTSWPSAQDWSRGRVP